MIRYLLNKMLLAMQRRYDYDVGYMQEILATDQAAFLKFSGFQTMSSHKADLPAEIAYAARLRTIIWDDCGPCTQLVVNMALEAKVDAGIIRAIIDGDTARLPQEVALVVRFTELVLTHDLAADELREEIEARWGKRGLIAIGYAISCCRVYPALKYALGYGQACSKIQVNEVSLVPNRDAALAS